MKNRRRKGIRGLILALAIAALVAPAANGMIYLTTTGAEVAPGYSQQALRANLDAKSAQRVHADDRGGVRGPGPVETPVVVAIHGGGFDWTDAGIGAAIAAFTAAVLLGGAAMTRRRRAGLAV